MNEAIRAKAPEQIETQHINHTINAILRCTLLKLPPVKKVHQNQLKKKKNKKHEEDQEILHTRIVVKYSSSSSS